MFNIYVRKSELLKPEIIENIKNSQAKNSE